MQIHDLNTKTLTNPAYVPFDDGTDTYKAEFNSVVADAAAAAVADADLTENEVAFTSGDAASPTAWTNVDVLTTGSTLATLFNKISTMIKNVRWLYSNTFRMPFKGDIGSSVDLNNLTTPGYYRTLGSANQPANLPTTVAYGAVYVIDVNGITQQFVIRPESNIFYIRARSGSPGTWYTWRKIEAVAVS